MKKTFVFTITLLLGIAVLGPMAQVQEPQQVTTHGELAKIMSAFLLGTVVSDKPEDHFKELMKNMIMPPNGWGRPFEEGSLGAATLVSRADLATVIGQALAQIHGWFLPTKANPTPPEVPTDGAGWLDLITSKGFPIGTVEQATDQLKTLPEPVKSGPSHVTTDPLLTKKRFNIELAFQDGAEIEDILVSQADIIQIMEEIIPRQSVRRHRASPVTPD